MSISPISHFLDKFEEWTCAFTLAISVIILFVNVVARYCFQSGFSWADEAIRYLIVYVTFVGLGMGIRKKSVISVDLLQHMVDETKRKILKTFIHVVELLFGVTMAYVSIRLIIAAMSVGERTLAMDIPIAIVYAPLTIGSLLIVIRAAQIIPVDWKGA